MSEFEHVLKTDPQVFQDVIDNTKTFEIRFNDRDYQVGQAVLLKETKFTGSEMSDGKPLIYTGRQIAKRISYVLSGYGLKDGWVILGITNLHTEQSEIDQLKAENLELDGIANSWRRQRDDTCEKLVFECHHHNSTKAEKAGLEERVDLALALIDITSYSEINRRTSDFIDQIKHALRGEHE